MGQKKSTFHFKSNEAYVLKELRRNQGLSMRQAGELIGKSDSYICHIENGRMRAPIGEALAKLLELYKTTNRTYFEYIKKYQRTVTPQDQAIEILKKSSNEQAQVFLKIVRALSV